MGGAGGKMVKWAASKGVEIIIRGDSVYPSLLYECRDSPVVLYYKGCADLNNSQSVAVIGTRLASGYGKECCRTVVGHFKKGGYTPLVVSGLAYGIDINAHKAAMDCGIDTVAVLANGIDIIYPNAHREFAKRMIKRGGILSEFPRGIPSLKINFIKRNRIIAGIVQGVIVIESRIKGGSMSTVEFADSYNRYIFAVPGRLNDTNSYGCNYLISKNVAAIYSGGTIVPVTLGWSGDSGGETALQPELFSFDIADKEKILLSLKVDFPLNTERIVSVTGLGFEKVACLLLELELEGKIIYDGIKGYCLKGK